MFEKSKELEPVWIQEYQKDKMSHVFGIYQCPYCCNFFVARKDSVNNGNTKSCGCLKRKVTSELGKANKKKNILYYPPDMNFGVCFYDNDNSYFLFPLEKKEILENYHCTAKINKKTNRKEPVVTIDGKTVLLTRVFMNTDENVVVDHVNHNTADLQLCNLRNCTNQQNSYNSQKGQGQVECIDSKYYVEFPKEDTSGLMFDSELEAYEKLCELQDKYYGEFSYRRSMENALENNSFYFIYEISHPVLKAISELPEKCWLNVQLHSIICRWFSGKMREDNALRMLDKLIEDYKEFEASGELKNYLEKVG